MESKNVLLIFNQHIMYNPLIYRLATEYNIIFNIMEAKILPKQEGRLILELNGTPEQIQSGIDYLESERVQVEILADKMTRNEERCTSCGACTAVCRTDALAIERESMEVRFDSKRCVACGLCKLACPIGAMTGISIDKDFDI